jgi:hypothetical protein
VRGNEIDEIFLQTDRVLTLLINHLHCVIEEFSQYG